MQLFCILSLTIHPSTITASVFAVWNFLASRAIGKGALAACLAFSTYWSWVYISDGTLYSGVWEHFGVCVEIIWWWSSYPPIRMFQLWVNVHRTFDSLIDISDNYSRYDIPVWDWASGVDENSRRPFSTIRDGCVYWNFWGHCWMVWGGLISAPPIPAGIWSFWWNLVEWNLAGRPANSLIPVCSHSGGIWLFWNLHWNGPRNGVPRNGQESIYLFVTHYSLFICDG